MQAITHAALACALLVPVVAGAQSRWSDAMEKDFSKWLLDHIDKLPVAREQIQELLKERTW